MGSRLKIQVIELPLETLPCMGDDRWLAVLSGNELVGSFTAVVERDSDTSLFCGLHSRMLDELRRITRQLLRGANCASNFDGYDGA
jgi:hypothetical protein